MIRGKNFHFCLVDEADSILIDEARTPLIISESVPAVPRQFEAGREVANALKKDLHYTVDEKNMNVVMTDLGEKVAQDSVKISGLILLLSSLGFCLDHIWEHGFRMM